METFARAAAAFMRKDVAAAVAAADEAGADLRFLCSVVEGGPLELI
jgi:hypothetical protein